MTNEARIIHYGDEGHLLYIARVSSNQENADPGLIGYLMRNGHWSPFEMIGACVEINTTRDIGRQILRHRSFSFQEFSQRYAEVKRKDVERDIRFKGSTNRQGSVAAHGSLQIGLTVKYTQEMDDLAVRAYELYDDMIEAGVAPECARAVLPEGLTPTRMYMNGTLRSWLHYLRERLHVDPKRGYKVAQLEHQLLAESIYDQLASVFPITFKACQEIDYIDR